MKKVAPKARSLDRESPFTVAAMACSRMPKCRFFPVGLSASKSPAPLNVSVVLFEGPRSAEPPRNHGTFCARTFRTLPEASLPARPLASAGDTGGQRASHPLAVLRQDVEDFARARPAGQTLGIGREHREVAVPALRQLTALHLIDL